MHGGLGRGPALHRLRRPLRVSRLGRRSCPLLFSAMQLPFIALIFCDFVLFVHLLAGVVLYARCCRYCAVAYEAFLLAECSVVLCLVHVAACVPVAASVSAVAGTDCRSESESFPLNARSVESAGSCRKRECAACMNFVRARCRTRRIQCLCFCRPAIRVSPPSWC